MSRSAPDPEILQGASHLLAYISRQYKHGKHQARGLIGTFMAEIFPTGSPIKARARYALDVAATRAGSYFDWKDFESDKATTQESAVQVIEKAAELALDPKL